MGYRQKKICGCLELGIGAVIDYKWVYRTSFSNGSDRILDSDDSIHLYTFTTPVYIYCKSSISI